MSYLERRADLQGKVAIVTGGAGGLGWPITRDLARAGVHVAICDRDSAAIASVKPELEKMPVKSLLVCADVREPDMMEQFFATVDAEFERVDILVNVPGGGFVAPLMDTNAKGWNAIVRQNFLYVLDTIQRAVTRMRAQGTGGSIINVTSIEAHRAVPNRAVYGAMKAALDNLARSLTLELGRENIRINSVAPDIFPTEASGALATSLSPERRKVLEGIAVPMARFGTGEDLSGCVLFLASSLASYVTGVTLHVDGGTFASSGWLNWPGSGWSNHCPADVLERIVEDGLAT